MKLLIEPYLLGPFDNNTFVVVDSETGEAAVIDPAIGSTVIWEEARQKGWKITQIWLTHAHCDHIGGLPEIPPAELASLKIGLHAADLDLYNRKGSAQVFGLDFGALPEPNLWFEHGQRIPLGNQTLEVRFTPGHTPGHVVFYSAEAGVAFCGDLVFYRSVGRTDLPGGNHRTLIESIRTQILTLPMETCVLCGHGTMTRVGEEREYNPFL